MLHPLLAIYVHYIQRIKTGSGACAYVYHIFLLTKLTMIILFVYVFMSTEQFCFLTWYTIVLNTSVNCSKCVCFVNSSSNFVCTYKLPTMTNQWVTNPRNIKWILFLILARISICIVQIWRIVTHKLQLTRVNTYLIAPLMCDAVSDGHQTNHKHMYVRYTFFVKSQHS